MTNDDASIRLESAMRKSENNSPESLAEKEDSGTVHDDTKYITGWKFYAISVSLLVAMFLVMMEASIISTAVLDITDHLGGYDKSSWLFTAYLLTYCGLQMAWAKMSDIFGRKPVLLTTMAIFTVCSGLCGATQTLMQLIHFRWMQGAGACGVFALVQLVFFELVPARKWPAMISLVTGVIALSTIIGPLLGGAITVNGSWRWIFLLNVPAGALCIFGIYMVFPKQLWNEPAAKNTEMPPKRILSLKTFRRLDVLGCLCLLASCIFIATGLQQAAQGHPWTSAVTLALLICAVPFVAAFFLWEWHITSHQDTMEPVFPWRFLQSRVRIGIILNTYFVGSVLYVCIMQIPQRFSAVHGLTPLVAATKLLSFGVFVPVGSSFAAVLMGKPKIPPCWIILLGTVMQTIGLALLSQVSNIRNIEAKQYGFQIIIGSGVGFVNAALTLLIPYVMERRDLATGTSAVAQFRMLGGLLGISIVVSVSTPYIRHHLQEFLSSDIVMQILERIETISELDPDVLEKARRILDDGYTIQIYVTLGFAVAQIFITLLMWTNQVAQPGEESR